MSSNVEVYWGDKTDGERRSADFDDARYAQAFATWLQSTDGIIEGSVRVKLPEQRSGGPVEQYDNPAAPNAPWLDRAYPVPDAQGILHLVTDEIHE